MKKLSNRWLYLYLGVGLVLVVCLTQCGLKALTVSMPKTAEIEDRVTFVMQSGAEPRIEGTGTYTTQLVAGIMVPKSWNARSNITMAFTSPKGNGTMRLVPDSEIEPVSSLNWHQAAKRMFGIGPNLVDDFEWIIFRSTQSYTFVNNEDIDFKVNVACNVGNENMLVSLGFYVGSSIENLRAEDTDYKKFTFSDPLEITGGEGDIVDFLNPQVGTVQPVKSLDNDIITLTFDAGVTSTILDGESAVYLHVRALDTADHIIGEVIRQDESSKLTEIGGKKFLIDIWPRGYFGLTAEEEIARLEYYYTDLTGTKRVGYADSDEPFRYTFRCD